jgi:osmoprotectant transport system permease protein
MSAAEPAVSTARGLPRPRAPALTFVVIVAAIAAVGGGFVSLAPNRLVSGHPVMLWRSAEPGFTAGLAICGAMLLTVGFAPPRRVLYYLAALAAGAALLLVLAAAGNAAALVGDGAPGLARVSLGAGFWIMFAGAGLASVDSLQRAEAGTGIQLFAVVLVGASVAAMAAFGWFDTLSLMREYQTRRDVFAAALLRHIVLVAAAVGPGVVIGMPLGVLALRRQRFEAPLFAVLNLLQTVPSIALFGLLLVPLSALATVFPVLGELDIGGVGPAPAIIALVLYALLPVARNTLAGIAGVSAATLDAARGMGMTRRQVFWRVEIPLALPVLLAGLRIVIVQAIGLAVVAALIGAGGLGTFIFEGLGQYAADLVLLGALPAIAMALVVDFLLRLLIAKPRHAAP